MGCNFYTLKGVHIGKRSAAGYYCWDCRTTLCCGGEQFVHYGSKWFDKCPICNRPKDKEDWASGSVGRELGFNKKEFSAKTGVKSCSSFNWAIDPDKINKLRFVKDEYGRRYTLKEFRKILEECPIRYTDMIGREFS
jgi:hypothetical protein